MSDNLKKKVDEFIESNLTDQPDNASYTKDDMISAFVLGYTAKEKNLWHPITEPPKEQFWRVYVTNGEDIAICAGDQRDGGRIELCEELGVDFRAIYIISRLPENIKAKLRWCHIEELLKNSI